MYFSGFSYPAEISSTIALLNVKPALMSEKVAEPPLNIRLKLDVRYLLACPMSIDDGLKRAGSSKCSLVTAGFTNLSRYLAISKKKSSMPPNTTSRPSASYRTARSSSCVNMKRVTLSPPCDAFFNVIARCIKSVMSGSARECPIITI